MTQQTKDSVLGTLRDHIVGPTRFATLLSCFELGIVEQLKAASEDGLNARQLAAATGVSAHNVEQILQLPVKEGFIAHDETTGAYTLDGLALLDDDDLARVTPWLGLIKEVCLRQVYHLTDSIKTGQIVGLQKLYGVDGNFYENMTNLPDLHAAWAKAMAQVTGLVDPWLFGSLDFPKGAKVLDLAGNTGQGAILAHRYHSDRDLHVTCFDLPEKETEALATFRANGLEDRCAFIGGDAFKGVPNGFDVVMIKHFLDMWDKENACRILKQVHAALEPGGQVYVMSLVFPENTTSGVEDFFPAYFLGCTMAQGGPQRNSTYQAWLEECGFEITKVIEQDTATVPADTIPAHGVICATKTA